MGSHKYRRISHSFTMSSQFLIQCLAHHRCSINKYEIRKKGKRKMGGLTGKGGIRWVSSICLSRSTLQPALNPKRLTYLNCLDGLLSLWLLTGFDQKDTLADQRQALDIYFLGYGSMQPTVPFNQPDPRPFPHSSSDWRKHSPPTSALG